jgi:hypothetical protein
LQKQNGNDRKVASFLSIFPKRDFFRVSNALIYKGAEASEQSTGFLAFVQKNIKKRPFFAIIRFRVKKRKSPETLTYQGFLAES